MKKVVPFTKTITFRTMIAEVTNIEVTHDLCIKDANELDGNILVDGTYKMTDASQIEEEFHYKLPFTIEIDPKYDLSDLVIAIEDFYFEIINEEDLKINVEIGLDNLEEILNEEVLTRSGEEKPIRHDGDIIPIPVEIEDSPLNKLALEIDSNIKESNIAEKVSNVSSIFSTLASSEETFSTYYVYIVREDDTIESIIDKYKSTREELQNYNDLSNVKVGSKLIIPCPANE